MLLAARWKVRADDDRPHGRQQLVDAGALQREEAEESRWSNVLWNCVGGDSHDLQPELSTLELRLRDTLLFCSDGLTRHVSDDDIANLIEQNHSTEIICHQLVDAANQKGGEDNITVIVCRFVDSVAREEKTHTVAVTETSTEVSAKLDTTTSHDTRCELLS